MIQHTRTNLLLLKEKIFFVYKSIGILKARRLALIKEFLNSIKPLSKSREDMRRIYSDAISHLNLAKAYEGEGNIKSLTVVTKRNITFIVKEEAFWGLRYKDVVVKDGIVRKIGELGYDYLSTATASEEAVYSFEKVVEALIYMAKLEGKVKKLSHEINKTTRKIKILEDRILPDLKLKIREINQYLGEREREAYYRLKIFKEASK